MDDRVRTELMIIDATMHRSLDQYIGHRITPETIHQIKDTIVRELNFNSQVQVEVREHPEGSNILQVMITPPPEWVDIHFTITENGVQ